MNLISNNDIQIRLFEESDIASKVEWINNPLNNEFLHYDIPLEYEKTLLWFKNKNNSNRLDCVIVYKNVAVGLIGLLQIDQVNKKAEFYISMGDVSYKGKGIATQATKLLLKYAFENLNLNKVYLNVDEKNTIACHLYEKVGFVCEGVFINDMIHKGEFINRKRYAIYKQNKYSATNILVLSAGTRNKIIQYFKRELNGGGNVIATDCSNIAPAIYEADKFYIVPRITEPNYLDCILDICKKEHVKGVLSLIDPELSLLAKNKERFNELGVTVIGSDYDLCELTFNKWNMYQWLRDYGYKCAKSYIDKEAFDKDVEEGKINYPVFVKPICGSASIAVSKVFNKETIDFLFSKSEGLMIQEFLDGQEIGADCYIDMISKEVVSIFTKKKLVMRSGETDKAVSFKDEKLFELIKKFCNESRYTGQIDIDIFDVNGEYYISEVNPRFGGGYPHAYECGCNHMQLIKNNLEGNINISKIGDYEENMYMMKYVELDVRKIG